MATTLSEESQKVGQRATNPYKEGSRAYQMYNTNPYTQETFTRKHTWWDSAMEGLGLRSGYESAQDEWLAAGRDYDAQIAEIDAADKYNSETAKAARMKEAGLNPDLTGLQGASEAEEFANKEVAPNPNVEQPTFKVANLIDGIGKVFMGAISMTREMAGTFGLFEDIKNKKLENADKLEKMVDDFLLGYVPEKGKTGNEDKVNLYGTLVTESDKYGSNYGLTKKQKQQFWNAISARLESKPGEIYERDIKNLKSRRDWGTTFNSRYTTTEDSISEITKVCGKLTQEIDDILMNSYKAQNAEAKYKRNYFDAKDGQAIAEGENAEAQSKKAMADMKEEIRKKINDAVHEATEAAKRGEWWGALVAFALPAVYAKYLD